jgi:hypothetical protein
MILKQVVSVSGNKCSALSPRPWLLRKFVLSLVRPERIRCQHSFGGLCRAGPASCNLNCIGRGRSGSAGCGSYVGVQLLIYQGRNSTAFTEVFAANFPREQGASCRPLALIK